MSTLDQLTEEFDRLLATVPHGEYSLEDWRYAYRKIVYFGAKRILGEFPDLIIGPRPPRGVVPVIEGQPPPYRPSAVNQLLCLVLGNCPQQSS